MNSVEQIKLFIDSIVNLYATKNPLIDAIMSLNMCWTILINRTIHEYNMINFIYCFILSDL